MVDLVLLFALLIPVPGFPGSYRGNTSDLSKHISNFPFFRKLSDRSI